MAVVGGEGVSVSLSISFTLCGYQQRNLLVSLRGLSSCSLNLLAAMIAARRMKTFARITNPRDIRRRLRMNQRDFWSRIGVTQSGGSRYESGRAMPKPVRELLRLVHIEGMDTARMKVQDLNAAQSDSRRMAEKATRSGPETLRLLGRVNGQEPELLMTLPLTALSKTQALRVDVGTLDEVVLEIV